MPEITVGSTACSIFGLCRFFPAQTRKSEAYRHYLSSVDNFANAFEAFCAIGFAGNPACAGLGRTGGERLCISTDERRGAVRAALSWRDA